jgi:1,2-diacylglycerol 3-beta-glucosyltransferase
MIDVIAGTIGLIVVAAGLLYFALMMGFGWAELRRTGAARGAPSSPESGLAGGTGPSSTVRSELANPSEAGDVAARSPTTLFVLIPCLNEELVIGNTVRALLEQDLPAGVDLRVVVVDDASDDATQQTALDAGQGKVQVWRREFPLARQGKGAAINDGFGLVRSIASLRELDPTRVVVLIMDADGRLSPSTFALVLPAFTDAFVGGVQLPVRIRNRDMLLTELQDVEFWGLSAVSQMGRRRTGSVSLGGNGQFTRMSALLHIGNEPWSHSLTEDLDLAITLAVRGWKLTMVPGCFVDQEAVTTVKALLKQRSRWFQGHMTCARRIPEVLRSRALSNRGAFEICAYLLVPYGLTLPWSIVGQYAMFRSIQQLVAGGPATHLGWFGRVVFSFAWYLLGFAPTLLTANWYRKRSGVTRRRAWVLAHALLVYNYLMYVAAWRAVWRMRRGQTNWVKTSRVGASPSAAPVLAET